MNLKPKALCCYGSKGLLVKRHFKRKLVNNKSLFMKKHLLLCITFFSSVCLFSQSNIHWKTTINNKKVFIENKSQFDDRNKLAGSAILFATEDGPVQMLFTKNGLTYSLVKKTPKFNKEKEEKESRGKNHAEMEREEHELTVTKDMVQMQWENSSPDVKVVGKEVAEGYQNYVVGGKNVSHVANFKQIVYQNLYPGIDLQYTFHEKIGIEYSFILHPGADVSQIKMKYTGVSRVTIDEKGEVHLPTKFGDIIDHAPFTYYTGTDKEFTISSRFLKSGKTVSFDLGNYDKTQTVIIDPWTVAPALPSLNTAYYIKSDSAGNAYIYGGDNPYRLEKYNSSGVLQWTYNTPWTSADWFGALAVDRAGNSFITEGSAATISKVDTGGHLVWSNSPAQGALALEYWAMDFNCDQSQIFVGGTRDIPLSFSFYGTVFKINMTNGALTTYYNICHSAFTGTPTMNEVRSMCSAPNGNLYYLTLDSVGSISQGLTNNTGQKSTYTFPYYLPYSNGGTGQGQNNIRANAQFLYTTDGHSLHKRDISTGNVLATVTIPNGSQYNNSGVAIDSCGNVYVGSQNAVVKYDANLNYIESDTTPSAVYDVSIGTNGDVFACGNSFAVAFGMQACTQMRAICIIPLNTSTTQTNPQCSGSCNGTATATATSGTGPYTYAWTGGQTTQTATNLCPGTYAVTINDVPSGATGYTSVVIGPPALFAATASHTPTGCGGNNGSATATVTAGTGPFTYAWSNNGTTQTINNLPAGNYVVTVSGAGGCSVTASTTVDTSATITLSAFAGRAGCTSSGTASVSTTTGNGPFTYSWSNGGTTSSINSLSAGNYSVTVTGAAGCSASASVTVISTGTGVTLTAATTATGCSSLTGTASATPITGDSPFTYSWSNGSTTASLTNVASGIYLVTVTGSTGCSATASDTVTTSGSLSFTTTATGTSCGNTNGSAGVTIGIGTYTYSWSNGGTTNTISNLAAATYTVTVNSISGCSATASAVVNPSGGGTVNLQAQPQVICKGDTSQVCAPAGYHTYLWNMGATSQCISVTQPGNYYLTVTDAGNCTATSNHISITVNTPDTVHVTTSANGDTLKAGNASSYQWYLNGAPISGATSNTYVATQDGNYYVETTDANGCSAPSNIAVIKIILGINNVSAESSIRVYPNPLANGSWQLEVSNDWIGSIAEVYDAAGRLVFKAEIKSSHSELEMNVAQGIYMLKLNTAQKNYAVKLIKL